jgi:hypothetical protein
MATDVAVPAIPFPIASELSSRRSFDTQPTALGTGATTISPIQVPAVGYLNEILLDVEITTTGSAPHVFKNDAPWSVIDRINLRNAAGVNLIAPVTGFQLYLMNKYGGQTATGQAADPAIGNSFSAPTTANGTIRFMLRLPVGLDLEEGYGAIPALASNANYQVELSLAGTGAVFSTPPTTATVKVTASAYYWNLPAGTDSQGRAQETVPPGGAVSLWQLETPTVSPGEQLVQSFNVGNVIRNHILILRGSDGERVDASLPDVFELILDNDTRFQFTKRALLKRMGEWFGYLGAARKANASAATSGHTDLDAGVFVLPYHALLGAQAGDPNNSRAQLLPTLSATLLQFKMQDFGANASKLEILTQAVSTQDAQYLYGK